MVVVREVDNTSYSVDTLVGVAVVAVVAAVVAVGAGRIDKGAGRSEDSMNNLAELVVELAAVGLPYDNVPYSFRVPLF